MSAGRPRLRRTTLVLPPGRIARSVSLPTSPLATSFIVPSPPKATTSSQPFRAASEARAVACPGAAVSRTSSRRSDESALTITSLTRGEVASAARLVMSTASCIAADPMRSDDQTLNLAGPPRAASRPSSSSAKPSTGPGATGRPGSMKRPSACPPPEITQRALGSPARSYRSRASSAGKKGSFVPWTTSTGAGAVRPMPDGAEAGKGLGEVEQARDPPVREEPVDQDDGERGVPLGWRSGSQPRAGDPSPVGGVGLELPRLAAERACPGGIELVPVVAQWPQTGSVAPPAGHCPMPPARSLGGPGPKGPR